MRLYETTFLINPQTDDVTIERQVNDVIDLIKSNGGKLIHEDRMGTRRLAYAIQGLNQAYYTSLLFESEVAALVPLDRHYRLGEAYLRSLTTIFDGDVEERTSGGQESEELADTHRPVRPVASPEPEKPVAPSGPVGRRESAVAEAPAEVVPETPAIPEAPAEEPVAAAVAEEPEKKAAEPTGDSPAESTEEADEL